MTSTTPKARRPQAAVGWGLFFVYLLINAVAVARAEPDLASPNGQARALGAFTGSLALPLVVAAFARLFSKRAFWPAVAIVCSLSCMSRFRPPGRARNDLSSLSAKFDRLHAWAKSPTANGVPHTEAQLSELLVDVEAEADRAAGDLTAEVQRCAARSMRRTLAASLAVTRAATALREGQVLDVSSLKGADDLGRRLRLVEAFQGAARSQRQAFDGLEGEALSCFESRGVPESARQRFLRGLKGDAESYRQAGEFFDTLEMYANALRAQLELLGRELDHVTVDDEGNLAFKRPRAASLWQEGVERIEHLERRTTELTGRLSGSGIFL